MTYKKNVFQNILNELFIKIGFTFIIFLKTSESKPIFLFLKRFELNLGNKLD